MPVFGILKRGGRVYTKMIPDARRASIMPIIKAKIQLDSIIYSDAYVTYDTLFVEGFEHRRINHGLGYSAFRKTHINGIENLEPG